MHRNLRWLAPVLFVASAGLCATARAGDTLSFDQSNYTINGNNTVTVSVYLNQTAGGPQVTVGNELLTAAVNLTFNNPTGIAAVLSPANVTGGSAFDFSSTDATLTNATLDETSILGISDLSTPLLLGTFTFNGLSNGDTTIQLASITPGVSFITAGADIIDPTNTPTAIIHVTGIAVPEPGTWSLTCGFLGLALSGRALGRRRTKE